MSISELSKYTAVSKYGRWIESEKRREVWSESTERVCNMMVGRFPSIEKQIREDYDYVAQMKVLCSQRAMQFGGQPILQHEARLYNCCGSFCDRLRFFQECFYLLLCGSGVGFSVQEHHIAALPMFSLKRRQGITLRRKTFIIPDSIEGWADAASVLISSYHDTPIKGLEEFQECDVDFDYSLIRPEGAPLSFGIGKAPGPVPLRESLVRVRLLLDAAIATGKTKLNSITSYDITMHLSDAVLAGGVRRSATICIFSSWDMEMAKAKIGNWRATNPQRGRSNNSAAFLRKSTEFEDFNKLFEFTREFGEPGFYWVDDYDITPNPCNEIGFVPYLSIDTNSVCGKRMLQSYDGPIHTFGNKARLSGVQMCNLTTINGRTVINEDDFYERCEVASRIGTYQATFTNFPYLGEVSEEIVKREALLGVSISGVMNKPHILLDPFIQRKGAAIVIATNTALAAKLGINPAARTTAIKPDGNSSCLMGGEPGVNAGHARRFFRGVQVKQNEAPYRHFRAVNPEACEQSVWSANNTDDFIRFCIEQPEESILKEHVTAVEQLANVKSTFINWIMPGRVVSRCTHPDVQNNVSNTVVVRPDEWDGAARYIYDNREFFAGNSFAASSCDRDYPQAPYTAVYDEDEQRAAYGEIAFNLAPDIIDHCLRVGFRGLWDGCDLVLNQWDLTSRTPTAEQQTWANRVLTYADMLFEGDVKQATYSLKDCINWAIWCKLKACYRPVDYTTMIEESNGTKLQGEIACSGGSCDIM